jgi:hypothetical protein
VLSTAALLETGLNLGPRTLVARIGLEVGEADIHKGALFRGNRDVFLRKCVPQRLDQFKTLLRAQPKSLFQQVCAHDLSISPTVAGAPNGLRLSGARKGVRCSRGLGR